MTRITMILWLSLIAAFIMPSRFVHAQYPAVDGRQFPLSQMTPPGVAAEWATKVGRACPEYFQPVRVSVPTTGVVTYYEGSPDRPYELAAPAQAGLLVGRIYRLRISQLPEFPGSEFFPSVELIDRLHPPAGKVEDFPVDVEFTLEELEWAEKGRLMTKVVYLDQPDRVPLDNLDAKQRITTVEPFQNVIAEADRLGRPVAIVRLGGRTPDVNRPEAAFFGPGGPIRVTQKSQQVGLRTRNRDNLLPANAGVVRLGKRTTQEITQR